MYGLVSIELTTAQLLQIRTARRSMLRRLFGFSWHGGRESQQTYVDWLQAATEKAERSARSFGAREWEKQALLNKWRWAGHARRREERRPLDEALDLTDGRRSRWRPRRVWLSTFKLTLGPDWPVMAFDKQEWTQWLETVVHEYWRQVVFVTKGL